jgi:hypothetical protein
MKPSSLRVIRPYSYPFLLSFLCLLCLSGDIRADESTEPYNLHIVVHVAENRLLTGVFRDSIERELHDGFQAALGDMGRVRVDHEHPRLKDVLERGLRTSLDEWKESSDWKTHFVLIDYSGVHYEIQTRQYDGAVGRASPVVRRDRTRDRDFVAKATALLLKQDFGVVGTVREELEGAKKLVKVELRGGGLGDMSRWVKKGDVFALAAPDGGSPLALRWSLLQVEQAPTEEPRNGECQCRFFHRYKVGSIAGYRCIKLGTVSAPLRLRWMERQLKGNKLKPLYKRLSVDIRRSGFEGEKVEKTSDSSGFLDTSGDKNGVFDNVAFVSVTFGLSDPKPQVPIPLVDDQPIPVDVIASQDFDTLLTIRRKNWQSNVADSVQMQAALFKRLTELGAKSENRGEMIQIAKSGLNRARLARGELREERKALADAYEAKTHKKDPKISSEDSLMQQLDGYVDALARFLEEQEKIDKEENDPQTKKWRTEIQRAKLLEQDLELGKAIDIYEQIRKEGYKNAELEGHLKLLHKNWDQHDEEARGFIYRVWPTLDSDGLNQENIDKARKAFDKSRKVGDRVSILKLHRGTLAHAERLNKELHELQPDLVSDDDKEFEKKSKISEQIAKLGLDIQTHLKSTDVK